MTRGAPSEEQGGAVHAKETAPFKADVPALGEHERSTYEWRLLCGLSMESQGFGKGRNGPELGF